MDEDDRHSIAESLQTALIGTGRGAKNLLKKFAKAPLREFEADTREVGGNLASQLGKVEAQIRLEKLRRVDFVSLTIFQYIVILLAMIIMIAIAVLQAYVQTISFTSATTLMILEGITRTVASGLMVFLLIFFTFRVFRYAIQMNTNLLPEQAILLFLIIFLNATPAYSIYMVIQYWQDYVFAESIVNGLTANQSNTLKELNLTTGYFFNLIFFFRLTTETNVYYVNQVMVMIAMGIAAFLNGWMIHFFGMPSKKRLEMEKEREEERTRELELEQARDRERQGIVLTEEEVKAAKQKKEMEEKAKQQELELKRYDSERPQVASFFVIFFRSYYELFMKGNMSFLLLIVGYLTLTITLIYVYSFFPSQVPFFGIISVIKVCAASVNCGNNNVFCNGANLTSSQSNCNPSFQDGIPFKRAMSQMGFFLFECIVFYALRRMTRDAMDKLKLVNYEDERSKHLGLRFFTSNKKMFFFVIFVVCLVLVSVQDVAINTVTFTGATAPLRFVYSPLYIVGLTYINVGYGSFYLLLASYIFFLCLAYLPPDSHSGVRGFFFGNRKDVEYDAQDPRNPTYLVFEKDVGQLKSVKAKLKKRLTQQEKALFYDVKNLRLQSFYEKKIKNKFFLKEKNNNHNDADEPLEEIITPPQNKQQEEDIQAALLKQEAVVNEEKLKESAMNPHEEKKEVNDGFFSRIWSFFKNEADDLEFMAKEEQRDKMKQAQEEENPPPNEEEEVEEKETEIDEQQEAAKEETSHPIHDVFSMKLLNRLNAQYENLARLLQPKLNNDKLFRVEDEDLVGLNRRMRDLIDQVNGNIFCLETEILMLNFSFMAYNYGAHTDKVQLTLEQKKSFAPSNPEYELYQHLENPETDIQAAIFVTKDKAKVVVAFRGTSTTKNVWQDIEYFFMPHELAKTVPPLLYRGENFLAVKESKKIPRVHRGFYLAYESIKKEVMLSIEEILKERKKILVFACGHSLGGALATHFAMDMGVMHSKSLLGLQCSTFGSPRTGNWSYITRVRRSVPTIHRFCMNGDPVPKLPPLSMLEDSLKRGFHHVGVEILLDWEKSNLLVNPLTVEREISHVYAGYWRFGNHVMGSYVLAFMFWVARVHGASYIPSWALMVVNHMLQHERERTNLIIAERGQYKKSFADQVNLEGAIFYSLDGNETFINFGCETQEMKCNGCGGDNLGEGEIFVYCESCEGKKNNKKEKSLKQLEIV